MNQSLTALATPLPSHTKAQSWHTKSESVTFLAQCDRWVQIVGRIIPCPAIPVPVFLEPAQGLQMRL